MPLDDANDLKKLIETSNQTIAALRSQVDELKGKMDGYDAAKIAKIEADLATTMSAKAQLENELKAEQNARKDFEAKMQRPDFKPGSSPADDEYKGAFIDWMRKGAEGGVANKLYDLQRKAADVRASTAASGGFMLPKEIESQLLSQLRDISPIRQISTVRQASTTDYHEVVNTGGFAFEWVGETATRNQTNTPNFADIAPTFGEISAKPQATRHSISDLLFDVESFLVSEGNIEMARGEGVAFISGDGTNKPTGFLAGPAPVATADASRAFGTLQYVASGQATALPTAPFDTTKDIVFSLKAGHRANAVWVMNSILQASFAKVKDSQGRYLLKTDVAAGTPYSMEGYDVIVAEDMPVVAANAFPVAFGDFKSGYLIVDIGGVWMARDELTQTGWVKFPMARRVGGKLRDTNAIKLLKIAAS